jgi:regulator of sirC expression with transglutaminase-like and TPR domain
LQRQDALRVLGVLDRILLLFPTGASERRDRGLIHYRLGNLLLAQADLQQYLAARPEAHDAFEVQQVLSQINRLDSL